MTTLSLKLPEALDVKLAAEARRRGETKSAIARQAIESFVNGRDGPAPASALDLAGDLAGSVKGPADLSHNKKHMDGYGR